MSSPQPPLRVFVIGCPRSGTTLVQAMLSAHREVVSFPETNFLNAVVGDFQRRVYGRREQSLLRRWRTRLRLAIGLANRSAVPHFAKVMAMLGRPDLESLLQRGPVSIDRAGRALLAALDHIAADAGKRCWVEKSPTHYAYLDYLQRMCPDARYIHVLRPGQDVAASLYDAAQRYPGSFWARDFATPEDCVRCWSRAISATSAWAGKPGHYVLQFSALLKNPQTALRDLSEWLGIGYDTAMLEHYAAEADALRIKRETWKDGVTRSLQAERKFERVFTAAQRERVLALIANTGLPGTAAPETKLP